MDNLVWTCVEVKVLSCKFAPLQLKTQDCSWIAMNNFSILINKDDETVDQFFKNLIIWHLENIWNAGMYLGFDNPFQLSSNGRRSRNLISFRVGFTPPTQSLMVFKRPEIISKLRSALLKCQVHPYSPCYLFRSYLPHSYLTLHQITNIFGL